MNTATVAPSLPPELFFERCTLYTHGEFFGNFNRTPCSSLRIVRRGWAQYDNALHLTWVPKGARRPRGIVLGYAPHALVLAGWDTPEPAPMFVPAEMGPSGVACERSQYSSFDEGWARDFDALIASRKVTILADMRGVAACAAVPVALTERGGR